MRKKIFVLAFLFILLLGALLTCYFLFENNQNLKSELNIQIKLSNDTRQRDSIYTAHNKQYSQTITKYVGTSNFYINKKKLSANDLAKLYNNLTASYLKAEDSLLLALEKSSNISDNYIKTLKEYTESMIYTKDVLYPKIDSGNLYKQAYFYAFKKYSFNFELKRDSTNKHYILIDKMSRADSAQLLYKYLKNRIHETSPGVYSIDVDKSDQIELKSKETTKKIRTP